MINPHFNFIKALEATQYLINKNNGTFDVYLLNKILYLAEREAWIKWGRPLTGDKLFSLPLGPVLTEINDLIKSRGYPFWSDFIEKENATTVRSKELKEIDNLSKIEVKLLDELYDKFGKYTFAEMKKYCHNLPEWEDPKNTSYNISVNYLLLKEDKTEEEINEIENEIENFEYIKKVLDC